MPRTPPNNQAAERPLRADAKRNFDQLVDAAQAEFLATGATASLEEIAKRAGVGIGTLYRHFPTRDDLIARVLHEGTDQIIAKGHAALSGAAPGPSLMTWLRQLVDYVTTYRGLTGSLAASYVAKSDTELCRGCEQITATGKALLERAQAAGEVRRDAEVKEIILSAHAAAWIAEQTNDPSAVDRLLAILFDGLTAKRAARARPKRSSSGVQRRRRHRYRYLRLRACHR